MDTFILIQVFFQNLTALQTAVIIGVITFFVGLWFFSDNFNDNSNGVSFAFFYLSLCALLYVGYQLILATTQTPK
ncbi:MAG: hypothetical protein ABI425_03715 [Patescibacteria group bacterium]